VRRRMMAAAEIKGDRKGSTALPMALVAGRSRGGVFVPVVFAVNFGWW
jgi:hypothetical protein